MCTSRKTIRGRWVSNSSTASRPLRASATISARARAAPGARAAARAAAARRRRSARSRRSWARARGRGRGSAAPSVAHGEDDLGAQPVRPSLVQLEPRRRAEEAAQAALAGWPARCRARPTRSCRRRCRRPTTRMLPSAVAARADLDAAAVLARVDAVAHRVLDQRQHAIGGNRSAGDVRGHVDRELRAGRACASASARGRRAPGRVSSPRVDAPACSRGIAARR